MVLVPLVLIVVLINKFCLMLKKKS